jgi:hypothetical protein
MIQRAMPAVALLLVGPTLPNRSTGRLQTKRSTLASRLGVRAMGQHPITGKNLYHCCNSQRQSKPDGFKRGRLKLRKRIMRIATWNVQSINKLKEVVEELGKYRIDIAKLTDTKKKGVC